MFSFDKYNYDQNKYSEVGYTCYTYRYLHISDSGTWSISSLKGESCTFSLELTVVGIISNLDITSSSDKKIQLKDILNRIQKLNIFNSIYSKQM